jgi:hypothetical protein
MNKKEIMILGLAAAVGASQVGCPLPKDDTEIEQVKQEVWEIYGADWFNSDFADEEQRTTALEEMIKGFNTEVVKAAEDKKLTSEELGKIGKFAETAGKYDAKKVPKKLEKAVGSVIKNYNDLKAKFDDYNSKDRIFLLMHKGKSIYGTTFSNDKKRDNSITIDVNSDVAKAFFGKNYAKLKEKAVEKIPLRYRTIGGINDALDNGYLVRMDTDQVSNLEKAAQNKDSGVHYISGKMDMDPSERGKLNSWYKRAGIKLRNFLFGEKDAAAMQVKYPAEEAKQ